MYLFCLRFKIRLHILKLFVQQYMKYYINEMVKIDIS